MQSRNPFSDMMTAKVAASHRGPEFFILPTPCALEWRHKYPLQTKLQSVPLHPWMGLSSCIISPAAPPHMHQALSPIITLLQRTTLRPPNSLPLRRSAPWMARNGFFTPQVTVILFYFNFILSLQFEELTASLIHLM
jgi:hypothetical protein